MAAVKEEGMGLVHAMVDAMIKAEAGHVAKRKMEDFLSLERELDERFESLTGMSLELLEKQPFGMWVPGLYARVAGHPKIVREFFRIKMALLRERGEFEKVEVYLTLEKAFENFNRSVEGF